MKVVTLKKIAKRFALICLFLQQADHVQASCDAGRSYFDMYGISAIDFGNWDDSGTVASSTTSCIASADTPSNSPKNTDMQCPYKLTVSSLESGGDFYLYLNGDSTNTGSERVLAQLSHKDINDGNLFETLTEGVQEVQSHNGGFKLCGQNGDNSELTAQIAASELIGKTPGSYAGTFRVDGVGGDNSLSASDFEDFSISITIVNTNPTVHLTHIDDLLLGSFSGLGDITQEEQFCAYTETGAYRLTISATNQDINGSFFLGSSTTDLLPFTLQFDDTIVSPSFVAVGNDTLVGLTGSQILDCGGADNATLRVSLSEQDLISAPSGTYVDTLTLIMEPE